ncbi:S-adenosylmethionine synthetase [Methylomarinovum caldicuralii]|uniref:Methionine adenosyltransferase n=1 Tax=Methylomarinovum caldicuralii TaxID=438856 RepID=A0AAU9CMF5_9GAMM|nr:methionine adenosyltransferase [Methylomarinovum caldicuralii]BCX80637.1 S-adenosylmethionine synthetase [Methylomarinovum caldicuralii]
MNQHTVLFTSEAVTAGHPDRLCDSISDAIVDRFLCQDPGSRVITECAISKGVVFIAARLASDVMIDLPETARSVIREIGYHPKDFDAEGCTVVTSIIQMPVEQRCQDESLLSDAEIDRIVAQNQTTVFGFACTHTPDLMPLPITLARHLANQLSAARTHEELACLSPDGTIQVGVELAGGIPRRLHTLALICGFQAGQIIKPDRLQETLKTQVIEPVLQSMQLSLDPETRILINPLGAHIRSGPATHSGMTGRKTANDTYGAYARHSGAALSGKDPLRIDRSGTYAARYAAKNVVSAGLAEACEVQLSYTIGQARPVSVEVDTFGTGTLKDEVIAKRLEEVFDFRVGAIIRDLQLRQLPSRYPEGFYRHLPVAGHFGASFTELPWERTDKAAELKG